MGNEKNCGNCYFGGNACYQETGKIESICPSWKALPEAKSLRDEVKDSIWNCVLANPTQNKHIEEATDQILELVREKVHKVIAEWLVDESGKNTLIDAINKAFGKERSR
jgi:hypothetical protein